MQKIVKYAAFALLFFQLVGVVTVLTYAQETVSADQINEVAEGLYCPVCESEPLDTCATQACIDWREEIGDQLAAGRTEQEIYDNFVTRYGPGVLAQPPAQGFTLLLWLGLPLGLLIGGYFFVGYMRDLRAASTSLPPKIVKNDARNGYHPPSNDSYLDQIEQELKE